jgi:mannose-binding lectin 2
MAMWLTKQRATAGPVFGSTDSFEGLAIVIDTYKNNRPGTVFPYVMAMYGDGKTLYDKNNDGKANEYAGCSARGIRGASSSTKLRLTYYQDKSLKLELQYKGEDQWTVCFEQDDPPAIPAVSYLGFSAETGELHDNHDIISVETKNLYSASSNSKIPPRPGKGGENMNQNMNPLRQKERGPNHNPNKGRKGGSWTWFCIKIVLFIVVIAGGYVGYTAWRTSKRSHRF